MAPASKIIRELVYVRDNNLRFFMSGEELQGQRLRDFEAGARWAADLVREKNDG